ncbi:MAG: ATP-binding protein [Streptosporangiaceae bacterium]
MPAYDSAGSSVSLPTGIGSTLSEWPLTSNLELGALTSAVPCARLHTRLVLLDWGLAHIADDAQLIVSELTTNAIQATHHPIALFLRSDRRELIIEVWDALPDAPRRRPHAIDTESGRGLELVSILSDRWGFFRPNTGGKAVWASLQALATPAPFGFSHPGRGIHAGGSRRTRREEHS